MVDLFPPPSGPPGRLPGEPVAVVDIGSNSVRLVVYERLGRAPTTLYNEKLMCGLGRGVATTGRLPDDGVERALAALARFRILCATAGVRDVQVLATAAARDAANGPDFLAAAAAASGQSVELLTGEREAALSAAGVIAGFHRPDGVVGDLGGGSLELVDVRGTEHGPGRSLPLGGLVLKDRSGSSEKAARAIARDLLTGEANLAALPGRTFYAVGGTWRSLARLQMAERDYPLKVMHGYVLDTGGGLLRLVERASGEAIKVAADIPEARRPLLTYGAVVLDEIVRIGRPARVVVSALGVREGLLHTRLAPSVQARDPLLEAAAELNRLRARDPGHAEDLIVWTDSFVASLGLRETEDERRLRHAACLLSDLGWRAHPDYRGEQSLALVAHGSFLSIDHPGRAFLALVAYFRHEGTGLGGVSPALAAMAGDRGVTLARIVAALFRTAFPVSVANGGVLPRAPLEADGARIVLRLPADFAPLANERLANRLRTLGKLVERETAIELR